jgi:uncharacterized phiE125 gp8 family phage protein
VSWSLDLVTGPAAEPIDVDAVKVQARIDVSDEDQHIEDFYIPGARAFVEEWLGAALLTQTWELSMDQFPCQDRIWLPRPTPRGVPSPRMQSVTSVKYFDTSQIEHTMVANTDYVADITSEPCAVILPFSGVWPTTVLGTSRPVVVRFVTGCTDAASIPPPIKLAIIKVAADFYKERELPTIDNSALVNLLDPYRFRYSGPYRA